jgi:hypothetical protein
MAKNAPDVIHLADVSDEGELAPRDRLLWYRVLKMHRGQPVEVIVRRPRRQRSSQQNRYYWGVVIRMGAEQLGYDDPEDLHEALAMKFLRTDPDPITGSPRRHRTPQTNTAEFSSYTERCREFLMRFCSEQGNEFYIPLPNEVDWSAVA